MTTVSEITTSHCQISFLLAWLTIWTCTLWEFHLRAKNRRENPSNIIEIQIHIHANFAAFAEDIAVAIARITNIHPSKVIAHRKVWFSFVCNQLKINIIHLINAHKANIHIISFPIKFVSRENISINHNIVINAQIANNSQTDCISLFLMEFIIAEIPENKREIHNKIFKNLQKADGLKTVTNPHTITRIAKPSISRKYRSFFIARNLGNKYKLVKYKLVYNNIFSKIKYRNERVLLE